MIIKKSNKGFRIEKFSKKDWIAIGKKAGWIKKSQWWNSDDLDNWDEDEVKKCEGCGKLIPATRKEDYCMDCLRDQHNNMELDRMKDEG